MPSGIKRVRVKVQGQDIIVEIPEGEWVQAQQQGQAALQELVKRKATLARANANRGDVPAMETGVPGLPGPPPVAQPQPPVAQPQQRAPAPAAAVKRPADPAATSAAPAKRARNGPRETGDMPSLGGRGRTAAEGGAGGGETGQDKQTFENEALLEEAGLDENKEQNALLALTQEALEKRRRKVDQNVKPDTMFLQPELLAARLNEIAADAGLDAVQDAVVHLVSLAAHERLKDLWMEIKMAAVHRRDAVRQLVGVEPLNDHRKTLRTLANDERTKQRALDEEYKAQERAAALKKKNKESSGDRQELMQKHALDEHDKVERTQQANQAAAAALVRNRKRPTAPPTALPAAVAATDDDMGAAGESDDDEAMEDVMGAPRSAQAPPARAQSQGIALPPSSFNRSGVIPASNVTLRDVLFVLGHDEKLSRSFLLYKAAAQNGRPANVRR